VINVSGRLVQDVRHDAEVDRAATAAGLAHHVGDAKAAPFLGLGGVLDHGARTEALGARHRSRLGLDQAGGRHVERVVRLAARLEPREPLARASEFFFVARVSSSLGVRGKLLSTPHAPTIPKRGRLA